MLFLRLLPVCGINGNIKELERFHGSWNRIDQLKYVGYDGNKLLKVDDWIAGSPTGASVSPQVFETFLSGIE